MYGEAQSKRIEKCTVPVIKKEVETDGMTATYAAVF